MWWKIGTPFPLGQLYFADKPHWSYESAPDVTEYIRTEGDIEYILDCRIFQSKLIRILLGQE